jgi:hypothetical protein
MLRLVFALLAIVVLTNNTHVRAAEQVYFCHRSVNTTSTEAQKEFDRGLTFFYAFNRQAAMGAFREATSRDPNFALAWWGVALALGPNYNVMMSSEDMAAATTAILKAKSLEATASPVDQSLIDALALRYRIGGDQRQLSIPYAMAMQKVAAANPDDADIQAIYLESMLDLFQLHGEVKSLLTWAAAAKIAVSDASHWPTHIGVLHYFIHLTEPDTGSMAIQAANTLGAYNFAPQASHLTHMPSHVYVYIGRWSDVAALNQRAVQMDITQAKEARTDPSHLDYFFHNLDFWYGAAIMSGNEVSAREAAATRRRYNQDAQWILEARLGAIEKAASLSKEVHAAARINSMPAGAILAYGLIAADSRQTRDTERVLATLRKSDSETSRLATAILQGRMAELSGKEPEARRFYTRAAALQDKLEFESAPPWYFYPRELLAGMELHAGNAAGAAVTAEAELLVHPNSVPALNLLQEAYTDLGNTEKAESVKRLLRDLSTAP